MDLGTAEAYTLLTRQSTARACVLRRMTQASPFSRSDPGLLVYKKKARRHLFFVSSFFIYLPVLPDKQTRSSTPRRHRKPCVPARQRRETCISYPLNREARRDRRLVLGGCKVVWHKTQRGGKGLDASELCNSHSIGLPLGLQVRVLSLGLSIFF